MVSSYLGPPVYLVVLICLDDTVHNRVPAMPSPLGVGEWGVAMLLYLVVFCCNTTWKVGGGVGGLDYGEEGRVSVHSGGRRFDETGCDLFFLSLCV